MMSSRALVVHAQTADEIGAAFHAREALVDLFLASDLIDEREAFRGVPADVEAYRRALPVDTLVLEALAVHRTLAIAKTDANGARAFLARDVGVGPAEVGKDVFDDLGGGLGGNAKEACYLVDDLALRVGVIGECRLIKQGHGRGERDRALRAGPEGLPAVKLAVCHPFLLFKSFNTPDHGPYAIRGKVIKAKSCRPRYDPARFVAHSGAAPCWP